MKRRTFVGATGAAAAAHLWGSSPARSQGARAAASTGQERGNAGTAPGAASQFFTDGDFNYIFLGTIGPAYYHLADVGACFAIADEIEDGDSASAVAAFTAAGDRLADIAARAAAAGDLVSARQAYFQASNYTFAATYFVDGMGASDRFAPLWRRHQELWDEGGALLDPALEHVRIPYEDTTLPGYVFKVDHSGRPRPLLIFNNGSDGGMPNAVWPWGGAPGIERGYNVLTFYGPGQGLALVDQDLHFRPDWEKVITPVVDYALTRGDVDPRRIALMGVSQGGYWVPRALAFEHRLAAAIADPGVWDVSTAWLEHIPAELRELLAAGRKAEFDRAFDAGIRQNPKQAAQYTFRSRPYGLTSPYDVYKAVEEYTLAGVVQHIRTPMFISDPEDEQFWPGQSQKLYDALNGPKKLVRFTAAEGANLHCEVMAPGLRAQRMFDWLDATLTGKR